MKIWIAAVLTELLELAVEEATDDETEEAGGANLRALGPARWGIRGGENATRQNERERAQNQIQFHCCLPCAIRLRADFLHPPAGFISLYF